MAPGNEEAKTGWRGQGRSWAQWFCLIGGGILLVRGAVGVTLDPVFESPGEGWHQLFHMGSGALLLAASRYELGALALTLGFGVSYAALAVAGIVNGTDVAGVIPIATSDNVIHTTLTLLALTAGLGTLLRDGSPAEATA